jgi:hypothetical protein
MEQNTYYIRKIKTTSRTLQIGFGRCLIHFNTIYSFPSFISHPQYLTLHMPANPTLHLFVPVGHTSTLYVYALHPGLG